MWRKEGKKCEHMENWKPSIDGPCYLSTKDYWSQSISSGLTSENSCPRRTKSPLAHTSHWHGKGA